MATKRIKVEVITILGTPDNYTTRFYDAFASSRILNEGETFEQIVEEEVLSLIEGCNFSGHTKDIKWIGDTCAEIRFEDNEFTVEFSLNTQNVTLNID